MVLLFLLSLIGSADSTFVGQWAAYETITPNGSGAQSQKVIAYDPTSDSYSIEKVTSAGSQSKKTVESWPASQVRAKMDFNIDRICEKYAAEKKQDPEWGWVCIVVKNNGVLQQKEIYGMVPFHLIQSIKKSPLHPKAGTETKIVNWSRPTQF